MLDSGGMLRCASVVPENVNFVYSMPLEPVAGRELGATGDVILRF